MIFSTLYLPALDYLCFDYLCVEQASRQALNLTLPLHNFSRHVSLLRDRNASATGLVRMRVAESNM